MQINPQNELINISELTSLSVIDSKKLAKISDKMKEIDRANKSVCKRNTQATGQLMTLTMLCDAPYRRLRQVLAQIEQKRSAIEDAAFKLRKEKVQVKRLRDEAHPQPRQVTCRIRSDRGAIPVERHSRD